MSINQNPKYHLIVFLSKIQFSSYEFKDIRNHFVESYPEFSSKKYYSKIYQVIRELVAYGLIDMDDRTCTYKYSSNYNYDELLHIIPVSNIEKDLKKQLIEDFIDINEKVLKLTSEISAYNKYINLYPIIKDKIINCLEIRQRDLLEFETELNVLKKIINVV